MGKNYGQKCLDRRAHVPRTTEQPPQTLLEFAQETAAYSSFSKFVLAAKTSDMECSATLYFGDTLFAYVHNKFGNRITVIKTESEHLYEGAFVHTHELERLASEGKSYGLRSGIHPGTEFVRKEIFDRLLDAIREDGGHYHVVTVINQGLEKIEMEERKKKALIRAECIFGDIASGKLKSDPLLMFKGEGLLGFGFDSMPKVFIVEYKNTPDGRRLFIELDAAPLETGGEFSVGTSIRVSQIFHAIRFHSDDEKNVHSMARYLIRLFAKSACLPKAKELVERLAVAEGWLDQPKQQPKGDYSFRTNVSSGCDIIHYTSQATQLPGGIRMVH